MSSPRPKFRAKKAPKPHEIRLFLTGTTKNIDNVKDKTQEKIELFEAFTNAEKKITGQAV